MSWLLSASTSQRYVICSLGGGLEVGIGPRASGLDDEGEQSAVLLDPSGQDVNELFDAGVRWISQLADDLAAIRRTTCRETKEDKKRRTRETEAPGHVCPPSAKAQRDSPIPQMTRICPLSSPRASDYTKWAAAYQNGNGRGKWTHMVEETGPTL